jgi:sugar lactone lactonase YvrE
MAASMNARGNVLIAYRDGTPTPVSILEWPSTKVTGPSGGRDRYTLYVSAIGDGRHQFHSIRIDQQDNIWGVSSTAKEIVGFSPDGKFLGRFSHARLDAPADIAWDANGNLFVADNGTVPKVVKFDRGGRFVAETPTDNASNDTLKSSHSLATDAAGNVYVADGVRSRIAVFDNGLAPRASYYGIGDPWALCIARGPREYLYSASNPDKSDGGDREVGGEIYRLSVEGSVLGRARGDAVGVGTFPALHHIDCREPNALVGVGLRDYVYTITFVTQ